MFIDCRASVADVGPAINKHMPGDVSGMAGVVLQELLEAVPRC